MIPMPGNFVPTRTAKQASAPRTYTRARSCTYTHIRTHTHKRTYTHMYAYKYSHTDYHPACLYPRPAVEQFTQRVFGLPSKDFFPKHFQILQDLR
jgi:hypothetical protein